MNGGKISGMFNSMFGELLLDRDCANILDDPNADPMDKDICRTFKQFNFDFPASGVEVDDGQHGQSREDPQSLRDSILKKPAPRQSERRGSSGQQKSEGDQDLDTQVATGANPSILLDSIPEQQTNDSFSSYTRVTITRRPDGSVEERHSHRDSLGNEEETTIVRDSHRDPLSNEEETTITRDTPRKETFRNKLTDWVWPKR